MKTKKSPAPLFHAATRRVRDDLFNSYYAFVAEQQKGQALRSALLCLTFVSFCLVFSLISWLHHNTFKNIQSISDERAAIIVRQVLCKAKPAFSIFLRPFSADGGLTDGLGGDEPITEQLEPALDTGRAEDALWVVKRCKEGLMQGGEVFRLRVD